MGKLKIRPYEELKKDGMYDIQADNPEITYNQIGKRGVRRIDGYAKASGNFCLARVPAVGVIRGKTEKR